MKTRHELTNELSKLQKTMKERKLSEDEHFEYGKMKVELAFLICEDGRIGTTLENLMYVMGEEGAELIAKYRDYVIGFLEDVNDFKKKNS
jgi:hypothetical protein